MSNKLNAITFGKMNVEAIAGRTDELTSYYAIISNFPVLGVDEETELFDKVKAGGEEAKEAKTKIINCNLRAVVSIVRKEYSNCISNSLSLMDLISVGNIGLMKAVGKFDTTRGNRFLVFATYQIRAEINNELNVRGRLVTDRQGKASLKHTSLDEPLTDDTDTTMGDMICISTDKESCVNESLVTDLLRAISVLLSPIESEIICFSFGIGTMIKSQWEIAEALQRTEERIRQIKEQAILKIRSNPKAVDLLLKYR